MLIHVTYAGVCRMSANTFVNILPMKLTMHCFAVDTVHICGILFLKLAVVISVFMDRSWCMQYSCHQFVCCSLSLNCMLCACAQVYG